MAVASQDAVLSHWCNLIENFKMSPLDFYAVIEEAVKRREVPNIEISRVDWNESGTFSAKREYLRVARGRHIFDVCGAPFGTGFFVSSWLARPDTMPWPITLIILSIGALILSGLVFQLFGYLLWFPAYIVCSALALWATSQSEDMSDAIAAIPIFGWVYKRIFNPETYYRTDTMLMFQQAVHNAVMEAVDQVTAAKGVRSLSEFERKPQLSSMTNGHSR